MSTTSPAPRVPRKPEARAAGQANQSGGGGDATDAPPAKSKKKLIMIVAGVLVVAAACVYFFVLAPKKASAEPAAPEPGTVVALESTSVNLAGGHYLRVGVALQMTMEASGGHEGSSTDGSQAKDLIISTFSGRNQEALAKAAEREKLKSELREQIIKAYDEGVMDIYFTEFVTQ